MYATTFAPALRFGISAKTRARTLRLAREVTLENEVVTPLSPGSPSNVANAPSTSSALSPQAMAIFHRISMRKIAQNLRLLSIVNLTVALVASLVLYMIGTLIGQSVISIGAIGYAIGHCTSTILANIANFQTIENSNPMPDHDGTELGHSLSDSF